VILRLLVVSLFPVLLWAAEGTRGLGVICVTGDAPLRMNQLGAVQDAAGRELTVSRLDLLLSGLQLQRSDGSWLSFPQWHGFFRGSDPTKRVPLPELPAERFTRLRFAIGVGPDANHGDPAKLPADHALHPVSSGMHWGWATGYIFLALEGRWQQDHAPPGLLGGFSYHLGNDAHLVPVELPLDWDTGAGGNLLLALDLAAVVRGIDIVKHGDSTHSRADDAVVQAMKAALPKALTLRMESAAAPALSQGATPVVSQLTPYPFKLGAQMPQLALPEDNAPTIEGVALGRSLFHDPRFSLDGSVSCASCHGVDAAFTDKDQRLSKGVRGALGTRNAMPIFNLAWAKEFFWDGRAKSLRQQALMPIQDAHEMAESLPAVVRKLAQDEALVKQFSIVFGSAEVTAERIGLALEQFMLTLVSQDSKFDRVQKGEAQFTAEEMKGFQLFLTEHDPFRGLHGADCFHCHGGPLFTNHHFMNIGLPNDADPGRAKVTGDAADHGKFRTPSLRNVAVTGPYMHDGRFQTLEEVIDHYDHGVVKGQTLDPNLAKHPDTGMKLSPADKAALVAFMRTLTDEKFISAE
jgi:cytochrome c peroxidase